MLERGTLRDFVFCCCKFNIIDGRMLILHLLWLFKTPPSYYPHLYPVLFSLYGVINLIIIFILSCMWQLQASGVYNFYHIYSYFGVNLNPVNDIDRKLKKKRN